MGHRALVGYRRPDVGYDVHYSHWGGEGLALVSALGHDDPFADGAVEPDPLAEGVELGELLSTHLDPRIHEALYLVSPAFRVAAYRSLWLGWGDDREPPRGAIVAAEPGPADRELRAWFRGVKTTLTDVVELGALDRRTATAYLESRVGEDHAGFVYSYVPETGSTADPFG